jgi:hypothetical protein
MEFGYSAASAKISAKVSAESIAGLLIVQGQQYPKLLMFGHVCCQCSSKWRPVGIQNFAGLMADAL